MKTGILLILLGPFLIYILLPTSSCSGANQPAGGSGACQELQQLCQEQCIPMPKHFYNEDDSRALAGRSGDEETQDDQEVRNK
jgi:hypothetical protein